MKKVDETIPREKIRKAAILLLFKKHFKPGVRGYELKKVLGKNYLRIIELLKNELEELGLTVRVLFEDEKEKDFEKATFYVVLKEHPSFTETKASGMRIDDLAALAVSIAYILARGGKSPSKEIEKILEKKISRMRVPYLIDKFIKLGYLEEDEKGLLYIGWRTLVEVDRETLTSLLVSTTGKEG